MNNETSECCVLTFDNNPVMDGSRVPALGRGARVAWARAYGGQQGIVIRQGHTH